ncbi:MAG: S1C family serine protease [Pseudomonadota bacterium]
MSKYRVFIIAMLMWPFLATSGHAEPALSPEAIVEGIVNVYAEVPAEARTADTLGRQRRGTGIVIDGNGLVLTVGYIILEASAVDVYSASGDRFPADVMAYDHESGFGLIRTREPLDADPIRFGRSADVGIGDPLLILSRVPDLRGAQVTLADRREFAGYWEYLLDSALFTSPNYSTFAGAALIDDELRLVGIGSLTVRNAAGADIQSPGNMFIPVDELLPIMGDLLSSGRRADVGRPWLGLYARDLGANIVIQSVAEDSPAARSGLQPGDQITSIASQPIDGLADFYRKLWSLGDPGVDVPLGVRRRGQPIRLDLLSADRYDWLRFQQSY